MGEIFQPMASFLIVTNDKLKDLSFLRSTMAVYVNATVKVSYLEEPLAATIFQISLWSTIAFLGVIGNLLVCIVILRRLKKTSMNYYLLSLAIADLGVLVIIYPVAVCKYIEPFVWLLGETFCLYMIPTEEIFFGASIWSITAIAVERYRNIVGADRYQFWNRSRARTVFGIFAVWLASFLVSCVPIYPIMKYDQEVSKCTTDLSNEPYKYTYNIVLFIVWYVIPLTVITFTYVKIRQRVKESFEFRSSMNVEDSFDFSKVTSSTVTSRQKQQQKIWRTSNKTARILTPLVILFGLAMFPLNALRLMSLIKQDIWKNKYYNLEVGLVTLFVIINSSANPLVYYLTSNEFKEAFKNILKGLRERKNVFIPIRRTGSLPASSMRLSKSKQITVNGPRSVNNCNNKETYNKSHNDCYTGNSSVNVQYESCV